MTELHATGNGPGGYGPGGGAPPGGGYGGPPPGGGGYGGPPQGGPLGGGYGGPPQGGPPQGGGGYGGPPQGGPPPGGGYGGPPPGGYGGPPMPPSPPQKQGSNVGMIVGIGCVGITVLGGIILLVAVFFVRKAATTAAALAPPVSRPSSGGTSGGGLGVGSGAATGSLKVELHDLRDFTGSFGKARYFVGELQNTGDAAVGYPSAKITLYDAANTAIDSSVCSSVIRLLPPGEKVPCTFSSSKADGFKTSKAEITPVRSYLKGSPAELKVEGIKFTPKKGYSPNQLEGKVTNLSSFKAKSVWALVSLYGTDGKIVGAEQTLVAGSDLDAGASAMFNAKVYNVAAQPQTYTVKAIGYGE